MGFSTKECAWAQTSVKILGHTLEGIRGFQSSVKIDKEMIFAAGSKAIDITEGNESVDVTIKVLKYEFDGMTDAAQKAGYATIAHVPWTAIIITIQFKLSALTPARTITIPGVAFSGFDIGQEQNAKFTEIPISGVAREMILS